MMITMPMIQRILQHFIIATKCQPISTTVVNIRCLKLLLSVSIHFLLLFPHALNMIDWPTASSHTARPDLWVRALLASEWVMANSGHQSGLALGSILSGHYPSISLICLSSCRRFNIWKHLYVHIIAPGRCPCHGGCSDRACFIEGLGSSLVFPQASVISLS